MKTSTIAILLIVGVVAVALFGSQLKFGGLPGNVFAGRIKMNIVEVKRIDGTQYTVESTQIRVIHGDMDFNNKVGDFASHTITGEMKAEDKGYWYMIIDYGSTNNTLWLDYEESVKDPYVTKIFGADGDQDGFDEDYVELYMGNLSPLIAGESYKEVEVGLSYCPARTSGVTFTSLTNSSAITTTGYVFDTATGYTTGFTEGDMAKIAKIELTFNATSDDYPDSEYWKLTHLKLGPYTFTASQFGGFDKANMRYQIKFGDQINHQGGRPLYYAKNAGALWASYELKAYCKFPTAVYITVSIDVYFYKPDGSLTSKFTATTTWTSS
jgi:hypothetical protein